jgi:hypothetical protein
MDPGLRRKTMRELQPRGDWITASFAGVSLW